MMGKSREGTTLHKGWWENWLGLVDHRERTQCVKEVWLLERLFPLEQSSWSSHHHLLTLNGPLGQLLTFRISEMSWVRRWPTWRFSIKLTYSSDRLFRGQLLCVQTPSYFSTHFPVSFLWPLWPQFCLELRSPHSCFSLYAMGVSSTSLHYLVFFLYRYELFSLLYFFWVVAFFSNFNFFFVLFCFVGDKTCPVDQ